MAGDKETREAVSIDSLGSVYRYQFGKVGILLAWSDDIRNNTTITSGKSETINRLHGRDPAISLTSDWNLVKAKHGDNSRNTIAVSSDVELSSPGITLPSSKAFFEALANNMSEAEMRMEETIFTNSRIVRANHEGKHNYLTKLSRFDNSISITNNASAAFVSTLKDYGPAIIFGATPVDRITSDWGNQPQYLANHLAVGVLTLVTLTELMSEKTVKPLDIAISSTGTFLYDDATRTISTFNGRYDLTTGSNGSSDLKAATPETRDTLIITPEHPEEVTVEKDRVELSDFAGLEDVISQLQDVADSFNHPEILKKYRAKRPHGILLSGPAGTGKTMLARGLATAIGGGLWEIKVSELIDKWLGNSQKNMQKIFDKANSITAPTVMLWDEIDAMLGEGKGDSGASREVNSMVGVFKNEMTKLADNNPNIIVAATTNDSDLLDDAVMRAGRFDLKLTIPLPAEAARLQIWNNKISEDIADSGASLSPADFHEDMVKDRPADFTLYDSSVSIRELAVISDGMSGADIVECLRRAKFKCAMDEIRTNEPRSITQELLVKLVRTYYR